MTEEMTIEQVDDDVEEYADYAAQMAHDLEPYTVFCDICSEQATASQKQLKANGWFLGNGMEICGRHE